MILAIYRLPRPIADDTVLGPLPRTTLTKLFLSPCGLRMIQLSNLSIPMVRYGDHGKLSSHRLMSAPYLRCIRAITPCPVGYYAVSLSQLKRKNHLWSIIASAEYVYYIQYILRSIVYRHSQIYTKEQGPKKDPRLYADTQSRHPFPLLPIGSARPVVFFSFWLRFYFNLFPSDPEPLT